MTASTYSEQEATVKLEQLLPEWFVADNCICRVYKTGGWKGSLMVTNAIGHLAEVAWHHPDLEVGYNKVVVKLTDHEAEGISDKDFLLAEKIELFVTWRPGDEEGALIGTPDDARYRYLLQG